MSTTALFTLEAYEHMAAVGAFEGKFRKRVELMRGEILEMSPIGIEHCNCVTFLTEWSYQVVPTERFMVRTQNPIRLSAIESEPEPDVVWVKRQPYSRHPEPQEILLLIEVANSSLDYDRGEKLAAYAEAGIPEYWIVNLLDEQIEVYRKLSERSYLSKAIYRDSQRLHPEVLLAAELVPEQVFAS